MNAHSQLARLGSRISKTSMERLPCEVWSMTLGSTPISLPISCQCFTIAFVESMIVPSMSKSYIDHIIIISINVIFFFALGCLRSIERLLSSFSIQIMEKLCYRRLVSCCENRLKHHRLSGAVRLPLRIISSSSSFFLFLPYSR